MLRYRALSLEKDWKFFVKDLPISSASLQDIHPLEQESALDLWRDYICSAPDKQRPMLLPASAWPVQLLSSSNVMFWQTDWNENDAMQFYEWLGMILPWSQDTAVIFTSSASYSTQTSWGNFRQHWRHFLLNDEGPFLWSLQQLEAIRFMPNGFAYAGSLRA